MLSTQNGKKVVTHGEQILSQVSILKFYGFWVIPAKAGIRFLLFMGVILSLTYTQPAAGAMELNTGGHIKFRGRASWLADDSPYQLVDGGPYLDESIEGRLKGETYFSDALSFEAHYEVILSGGDTRKNGFELAALFPGLGLENYAILQIPEDNHRVFDLTALISNEKNRILYHRLDRLVFTFQPEWGAIRIGRQVVTWGNGMLFNPMDLFNPFAPTDIEREYKVGDDMLSVQGPVFDGGDLHLLYVPRRDLETSDISWDQSSLAAKYHLLYQMAEFNIMFARHYEDYVFGIGSVGYVGNAAWRTDITWTKLDAKSPSNDFFSLVANLDYSWVWLDKNCYGFLEYYDNGIGEDKYEKVIVNPDILSRIQRGELYTLGKTYLAGSITIELHPLFNLHLTSIVNLKDPSGFLQPMATYDIRQNFQILMGANIPRGPKGSEFGGIEIPGTDFTTRASNTVYMWISYYF